MNFKKNWKRFWTLSGAREGFTLVELIVVIAILAILAGVAVPAYSGYVKKANIAADEALLNALNTAFASACAINGANNYGRTDTSIKLTNVEGGKAVDTVSVTGVEGFEDAFDHFYEGGTFKVYDYLMYDGSTGMFVEGIGKLAQILAGTSFAGHLNGITGDVDNLVGMLSEFLGKPEGQEMLLGSGFADYLEAMGIDASDPTSAEVSNAAVLYLAKQSAQMSGEAIQSATATMAWALIDYMDGQGIGTGLIDELAKSTGSQLAAYATYYATAEAIALSQGTDSAAYRALIENQPTDPVSVLAAVEAVLKATPDDVLNAYIGEGDSSQMITDLDAYFQTLAALNSKEDELLGSLGEEDLFENNDLIQELIGQLQG